MAPTPAFGQSVSAPPPAGKPGVVAPPAAERPAQGRTHQGSGSAHGSRAYRLEPFGAGCRDRSEELADLHALLLGHSPVALLGRAFMSRFYYRVLPRLGLICGHVAYVDERPAGFIVATHDSSGFMQAALRRRFLHVAWVLAWSVLRDPSRLGAIMEAVRIMRGLPPPVPGQSGGEILSFGVLPEFRARDFVMRTRLRISQDLLNAAIEQLSRGGTERVRVIVDADNLEARLFYLGNGWRPGMDVVPGWRKVTVEFLWEPPSTDAPYVDGAPQTPTHP